MPGDDSKQMIGDKSADLVANNCHQSGLVTEGAPRGAAGVTKEGVVHLSCLECGTTYACLDRHELVIRSKHRGVIHENRVSVGELVRLVFEVGLGVAK